MTTADTSSSDPAKVRDAAASVGKEKNPLSLPAQDAIPPARIRRISVVVTYHRSPPLPSPPLICLSHTLMRVRSMSARPEGSPLPYPHKGRAYRGLRVAVCRVSQRRKNVQGTAASPAEGLLKQRDCFEPGGKCKGLLRARCGLLQRTAASPAVWRTADGVTATPLCLGVTAIPLIHPPTHPAAP